MGSGHFLVEAVDHITDKLLQFLNAVPDQPGQLRTWSGPARRSSNPWRAGRHRRSGQAHRHQPTQAARPQAVHLRRRSQPDGRGTGEGQPLARCLHAGAPLSFLDHHLRCGNSLVGATLDDFEKATAGRLFRPRLRALAAGHQLRPLRQQDRRRDRRGGRRLGEPVLPGQEGAFGLPDRPGPAACGAASECRRQRHWSAVATTSTCQDREKFLASLHERRKGSWSPRSRPSPERPDHCFFHWEVEFPEVFFGFRTKSSQIRHKRSDRSGLGGF